MKYIKDIFKEIGYSISGFLRCMCGGLSTDARIMVILSMLLLFAIGNICFTVSAIYGIMHKDGNTKMPEIQHIERLDIKKRELQELLDYPIELQLQDSINNKIFINDEERTK